MARLQIVSGPNAGTSLVLDAPSVTVGRVRDNLVCLPDITVSRCHAVFVKTGADYELRDLNSTNGTYVNEKRITQALLQTDTPLRFGAIKVLYSATPVPAAPPPEPPAPPVPPAQAPPPVVAAPTGTTKPKPQLSIGSVLKKREE